MKTFILFGGALLAAASLSHAVVTAGDVAIVRANATNDGFSVLALRDLSSTEDLFFTDAAWQSGGGFASNEGAGTTDILTADISAGMVFDVTTSGTNASGEQFFLFTGTKASPSLVFGLNWNNAGWITTGSTDTDISYEPNQGTGALSSSLDYLSLGTGTGAAVRYSGTLTGTPLQLRTAISNPANWESSSDTSWTRGAFAIPEPSSALMVGFSVAALFLRKRARASAVVLS
jgi:hypothetical protein